jgi:hypothetical protein
MLVALGVVRSFQPSVVKKFYLGLVEWLTW